MKEYQDDLPGFPACKTEKVVLEQQITIRDIIICVLFGILFVLIYLFVRRK